MTVIAVSQISCSFLQLTNMRAIRECRWTLSEDGEIPDLAAESGTTLPTTALFMELRMFTCTCISFQSPEYELIPQSRLLLYSYLDALSSLLIGWLWL